MASGRGNLRGAKAMDQGDGEIAQGGQNLWGVAGAQAGAIFPKGDIAHIMAAILDAPMPAIELQQALGTGLGGSEGSDEIDHLGGRGAGFGHAPDELRHLCDKGPASSEIGVHFGTDLDGAHFDASPSAVNGLGLQIAGLRIGKVGHQVRVERGLIAFDGQDRLSSQGMHEAHEFGVGMERVGGTDPLPDGQRGQYHLGDRDLVGFLIHAHLPERFLAVMGTEGQQMRSGLLADSGAPHGLAIESQRLVGGSRRGGLDPPS